MLCNWLTVGIEEYRVGALRNRVAKDQDADEQNKYEREEIQQWRGLSGVTRF